MTTETPCFGKIMSRNRFMNILRFIHFVDSGGEVRCDPALHDRLYKIRSVLDELQRQFRQNYIPAREISIDETMVKLKGRKFFRQFFLSKPIQFGFKLFTIAESCTGYICDFEVYTGRKVEAELNETRNVVLRLMRPLKDIGFSDNYNTSPELYFSLRERGSQACGTVRPNRKDLPKEIMDHKLPLVKNLQRGECTFMQKGELVALTWKDKNLVSTIPIGDRMDTATHKVRVNGAWQAKEFGCPVGIKLYNASMGGVDLADQRITSYKKHFKTCIWYLALFFHGPEQCCLNGFISMQATPGHQNAKRTQLSFCASLSKQLIGTKTYVKKRGRPSTPLPAEMRFNHNEFHHLVKRDGKKACMSTPKKCEQSTSVLCARDRCV